MALWHYVVHGRASGPVETSALATLLQQGAIGSDTLVWRDGLTGWTPAREVAELLPARTVTDAVPPPVPPPIPSMRSDAHAGSGDVGLSSIIPYKNPPALTAYYLGVFALIPILGIPLAIGALVLGIVGLRRYRRTPTAKGVAHAWIGILLGALMLVVNAVLIVLTSR